MQIFQRQTHNLSSLGGQRISAPSCILYIALLPFRWSCLTEDGMRCVLNGNGFLEDEILTTEPILKVRNGSLVTGR